MPLSAPLASSVVAPKPPLRAVVSRVVMIAVVAVEPVAAVAVPVDVAADQVDVAQAVAVQVDAVQAVVDPVGPVVVAQVDLVGRVAVDALRHRQGSNESWLTRHRAACFESHWFAVPLVAQATKGASFNRWGCASFTRPLSAQTMRTFVA